MCAQMSELEEEADRIQNTQPEEAEAIRQRIIEIRTTWTQLRHLVEDREAKLAESGNLQHFLRDLDHFQNWLTKTTTAVASADQPNDLQVRKFSLEIFFYLKCLFPETEINFDIKLHFFK